METNLCVEEVDLNKAKRDLLLRFIKDQEQLQTSQDGLRAKNNDETFDILDGIAVSEDCSNNVGINNSDHKLHSKAGLDEHIPARSQTCIPQFRTIKKDLDELKEDKLQYRIKSGKKVQEKTILNERPSTEGNSVRRLRSAPTFTGRQSKNILRSQSHIEVKTRKVSSLNIFVPQESDIDKLTKQRSSLTCAQVSSRPTRATVGISAVDVELFDKHTVPSITGPYTMYHLPPIASESTQTPPST